MKGRQYSVLNRNYNLINKNVENFIPLVEYTNEMIIVVSSESEEEESDSDTDL